MSRLAALLVALLLSGCATGAEIDLNNKVEGWPRLAIVEHFVEAEEMRSRCAPYVSAGYTALACAEYFPDQGVCRIWHAKDPSPSEELRMHEIYHCLGYDHYGDHTMRRLRADWGKAG